MKKCILCICDLEKVSTDIRISDLIDELNQDFMVARFHLNKGIVTSHDDLKRKTLEAELMIVEDFGYENIQYFNDYLQSNKNDFLNYFNQFEQIYLVYHESNKKAQEETLKRVGFPLSRTNSTFTHHGSGILSKDFIIELLLSSNEDDWKSTFNRIAKEFAPENLEDLFGAAIHQNSYTELDAYINSIKK